MDVCSLHRWDLSPGEALDVQEKLRERVVLEDRLGAVRTLAGLDVHADPRQETARAAAALLSFPALEPLEEVTAERPVAFPYIPGLFSFREIPPLLDALAKLRQSADLFLCDGQGYAHPRRFGLACHLGVLLDLPAIGIAKTILVGRHDPLPAERGAWRPLVDAGEVVGAALRTHAGVRPVYVSVGHRVSLETAIGIVLQAAPRYRLPEPLRRAHGLAGRLR